MQETSSATPALKAPHSTSDKILRAVILGALAMLGFYLKILGGILKLGMAAVRRA